jgi:hypothetical protein
MSEHLSTQTIEGYGRRELTAPELLVADDHLATCDECYQRVSSPERLPSAGSFLVQNLQVEAGTNRDHLSYEQLVAMVDNAVDDVSREIAVVHLEVCSQCAAELAGLQALREAATTPAQEPTPRRSATSLEQFLWWWRQPGLWDWPRLAGATLTVLFVGTLAWVIWRSARQPLTEVADSTHPAVVSESPVPSTGGSEGQVSGTPSPNASQESSPRIVVALNDGGQRVMLDEAGNLIGLPTLPPSYYELIKTTLSRQRLILSPALEGLSGKDGVQMGAPPEGVDFTLVSPVGTIVRSNRPTFRWHPLAGARSYVVKVFDTSFKNVAVSLPQAETEWKANVPLARGSVFLWQVIANKNGEEIKSPVAPAPGARFRVLARAKTVEVEHAERTYSNSHLVLGTLYAQAGLMVDAEREFRLLLKANPGSALVQKLLQNVSARP